MEWLYRTISSHCQSATNVSQNFPQSWAVNSWLVPAATAAVLSCSDLPSIPIPTRLTGCSMMQQGQSFIHSSATHLGSNYRKVHDLITAKSLSASYSLPLGMNVTGLAIKWSHNHLLLALHQRNNHNRNILIITNIIEYSFYSDNHP